MDEGGNQGLRVFNRNEGVSSRPWARNTASGASAVLRSGWRARWCHRHRRLLDAVPSGPLKGVRLRRGMCEGTLVSLPEAKVLVKELRVGNVDWTRSASHHGNWRLVIVLDHLLRKGENECFVFQIRRDRIELVGAMEK